MYCPRCGSEFVPGIAACPDCEVQLVAQAIADAPPVATAIAGPEIVFASGRPELIAVGTSVLRSAGIDCVTSGEHVQELLGWGRFPFGDNLAMGPVRILVSADDAEDARALLAEVQRPDDATSSIDGDPGLHAYLRNAKVAGRIVAIVVLAYWLLQIAFGLVTAVYFWVAGLLR